MISYLAAFCIGLAVLGLLKFVQDSPVRSWKVVMAGTLGFGAMGGYYCHHAFPAKAPPAPAAQKVEAYRAELERTFRRIDGVDNALVQNSAIWINFTRDKPLEQLKQIALQCGATAAYFFRINNPNSKVSVHITVQNNDRYEMTYAVKGGVQDEKVYP